MRSSTTQPRQLTFKLVSVHLESQLSGAASKSRTRPGAVIRQLSAKPPLALSGDAAKMQCRFHWVPNATKPVTRAPNSFHDKHLVVALPLAAAYWAAGTCSGRISARWIHQRASFMFAMFVIGSSARCLRTSSTSPPSIRRFVRIRVGGRVNVRPSPSLHPKCNSWLRQLSPSCKLRRSAHRGTNRPLRPFRCAAGVFVILVHLAAPLAVTAHGACLASAALGSPSSRVARATA
jgi:hypothetical protein